MFRRRNTVPGLKAVAGGVLGVASIIALLAMRTGVQERARMPFRGITSLLQATEHRPYRPVRARLSGFPYRPLRQSAPISQAAQMGGRKESELMFTAAALVANVRADRSAGNLHVLGIAHIFLGNTKEAVSALEEALRTSTGEDDVMAAIARASSAELLNDFAAACQALIEAEGALDLQPATIEAVEAAWRLRKTPEIAWTRAVVVDTLNIPEDSRNAWNAYLALDQTSRWSDEARQRLRELSTPTEEALWPAARARLLAARSVEAATVALVRRFPQQVRLLCEDELLPAWGDALVNGDPAAATARLDHLVILGRSLARATGEEGVVAAIDAIRKARPHQRVQLAHGHAAYGEGRRAIAVSRASESLRHMEIARSALTRSLTPFAPRAETEHAAAIYLQNDYVRALRTFERLEEERRRDPPRSAVFEARLQWAIALMHFQMNKPSLAVGHYTNALRAFQRAGEKDYQVAMHTQLADALESSGQASEGRKHRHQALVLLRATGNARRRHLVIFEAAYAAIRANHPALADLLLDRVVANDVEQRDPVNACTSLMWRSAYRAHRHSLQPARTDLARARQFCTAISDDSVRERALANLGIAQASLTDSREVSVAELDRAVAYFERTQSHVWLRTAYLTRARARFVRGSAAAAEEDYRAAIAEGESARDSIEERETRVSFTATADDAVDAYVEFLLGQRRDLAAFEVADQSRARELVDSPSARWRGASGLAAVRTMLPRNAIIVEYRVLRSSIVAWIAGSGDLQTVTLPASIAAVRRSLDRIGVSGSDARRNAALARLYDGLLRPLERHLAAYDSVIIIPDDDLERVPYPALYDAKQKRHFAETKATTIAPSAVLFAASVSRLRKRSGGPDRMLVLNAGNPAEPVARLAHTTAEASSIARIFPATRVLGDYRLRGADALNAAGDATILHFAGHTVPSSAGAFSRSLLVGTGKEGRMTGDDVLTSRLNKVRLVYLSACETDAGPVHKGEGTISLARSFLAAGVPAVVATLWPVDDAMASRMTRLFYTHLQAGWPPAEALQRSQVAVLTESRACSLDWAAFRVIGAGVDLHPNEEE